MRPFRLHRGTCRATVTGGDPHRRQGDKIWDALFGLPSVGADFLDNPANVKRAALLGPGSWAANLAIRKSFRVTERVALCLGATFDNLFNHPLFSPVGDPNNNFALMGSFRVSVNLATLRVNSIDPATINSNADFSRLRSSFSQEGIDSRRPVRLSLRLSQGPGTGGASHPRAALSLGLTLPAPQHINAGLAAPAGAPDPCPITIRPTSLTTPSPGSCSAPSSARCCC